MVAQKGTGQQSMNSGEFAPDLAGRVDIKQYYSAGLRYLNVEPVPQAGFRALGGTRRIGPVGSTTPPRFWRLKRSRTQSLFVSLLAERVAMFDGDLQVADVPVAGLAPDIQAEASLYLEGDTIGIFHRDMRSQRLLRIGNDATWRVDAWPYQKIPDVDYGGSYQQTRDVWEIFLRWSESVGDLSVNFIVDGEATGTIFLNVTDASYATPFAARVKAALEGLPSLGPEIGVTIAAASGDRAYKLVITFGGAQAGREFAVSAQVLNTSEASALAAHAAIGDTTGEAAISAARGWPGVVTIVQDRLVYAALGAKPSGLLFSQTAEYYNVNTAAIRDDGAKLEAIRSNSAEEILHVKDSKYLLVFTDEAEYFTTNRVLKRGEPLNFIETTRNGLARGTWPVEIENRIYYVGQRGAVLFSTAYDDISSAFTARMESLLAPHLVDDIVMSDLQRGTDDTDAPRLWLLRRDGRLVGSSVIRDQEITAFFEYSVGAPIRSIGVDSANRLWLCVDRPEGLTYEVMDESSCLASGVATTTTVAGIVAGLPFPTGTTVWCETGDGTSIGPLTVNAGSISTGWASTAMRVGIWVAPKWESMPRILVTGDDKVVRRPGRIHTLHVNVMDTTSIAIGANGVPARDVALLRTTDPVDAPMPAKTQLVTCAGIPGTKQDTTAVITQTRPGRLRVRDVTFEEKL